jgi:hypothetical protein
MKAHDKPFGFCLGSAPLKEGAFYFYIPLVGN